MKICTFNVNSIRARLELLISWMNHRGNDIDILCLQELKTVDGGFPYSVMQEMGFSCEVFGQKAYNGVALCSKLPLNNVRKGVGIGQWDEQKRAISAEVGGVYVVNVYAPHGDIRGEEKYYYKLQWYEMLGAFLQEGLYGNGRTVIVGDFNVALSELDIHDPMHFSDIIGTMPEERGALEKILKSGYSDAFRHLYPERKQFTWWNYGGGAVWKNEGMRLDYVLCNRPLVERLKDVEVDMWPRRKKTPTPSDHAPVIATFET